jgi:hypothetical protein
MNSLLQKIDPIVEKMFETIESYTPNSEIPLGKYLVVFLLDNVKLNESVPSCGVYKIVRAREKTLYTVLQNNSKTIPFVHYSVVTAKNQSDQENIYITMLLNTTPPYNKTVDAGRNVLWKTSSGTKKMCNTNKWEINKVVTEHPDACIVYKGIQYYHVPTIKKFLEEV